MPSAAGCWQPYSRYAATEILSSRVGRGKASGAYSAVVTGQLTILLPRPNFRNGEANGKDERGLTPASLYRVYHNKGKTANFANGNSAPYSSHEPESLQSLHARDESALTSVTIYSPKLS